MCLLVFKHAGVVDSREASELLLCVCLCSNIVTPPGEQKTPNIRIALFYQSSRYLDYCTTQEEAAQKAREAKAKAEVEIARRVAEEMGMGSVGKGHGVLLAAQRIQRKMAGEKVMFRTKYLLESSSMFFASVGFKVFC